MKIGSNRDLLKPHGYVGDDATERKVGMIDYSEATVSQEEEVTF